MKRRKSSLSRSRSKRKLPLTPIIIIAGIIIFGVVVLSSGVFRAQPISINEVAIAAKVPSTVILSLVAPSSYLAPNQEVDINVQIATGKAKVTAVQANLLYDPTKLSVISVTPSNLLPAVLAKANISDGKVSFIYGATPSSGGYDGTGTLATLKVKPLVATTSSISFAAQTQVSAVGSTESVLRAAPALTINSQQQ
jgi:hypothetical protein